jgi:hypothetical protein
MNDRESGYRVLLGNPEGKTQLVRPRHKWEDIKMDLKEA